MEISRYLNRVNDLSSPLFRKDVVNYSLYIGIIGGTIVKLVNQVDLINFGKGLNFTKIICTYIIFYCLGSYRAIVDIS